MHILLSLFTHSYENILIGKIFHFELYVSKHCLCASWRMTTLLFSDKGKRSK